MKSFTPLTRKNHNQPVRYLVVDDSVFARKNLGRMIESFGGEVAGEAGDGCTAITEYARVKPDIVLMEDRKSTRLNSSHPSISYAVFCLKKKKKKNNTKNNHANNNN